MTEERTPINPLNYTREEWMALDIALQFTATAPALGAWVSHSNYHLCAIIHALRSGTPVAKRVLDSYPGTSQFTFAECIRKAQAESASHAETP